MGTVYEAIQIDLGRRVALKVLHSRHASAPKIVERFYQEARLAGSIDHDNICGVTDQGTTDQSAPYLVMPLLSGRSFADMLAENKPRSLMQIADIVCQTLSALEAAHEARIIHRDLKPDNVFITDMGDRDDFVKLLDFGISKVIEQEEVSKLTTTGVVLGTAYYLAPEQARGEKEIDHRVDIYAMGVILYEALTGRRPFDGETYNEVLFKIAGDPYPAPSSLNPRIPRSVEQVVLRAMGIDPGERFASAGEMREALEQSIVSAPERNEDLLTNTVVDSEIRLVTPRNGGSHWSTQRRWRVLATALAVFVVIATASAVLLSAKWRKEKPAVVPPSQPIQTTSSPKSPPTKKIEDVSIHVLSPVVPKDTVEDKPVELEAGNSTSQLNPAALKAAPPSEKTSESRSNRPKRSKKKKKRDSNGAAQKIIKGRFGTTFIFENDEEHPR